MCIWSGEGEIEGCVHMQWGGRDRGVCAYGVGRERLRGVCIWSGEGEIEGCVHMEWEGRDRGVSAYGVGRER